MSKHQKKLELQNELISYIESWVNRGKPLGLDSPQKAIDIYEEEVIKLNLPQVIPPAIFSSNDMIAFGNFIRDNYYVAGSPKMLSYHPEKYPHAKVDEIFVYWCFENGR